MSGQLVYLGVTHRTATLSFRESIRCDADDCRRLIFGLNGLAAERMVLHTCERFEVYGAGGCDTRPTWLDRIAGFLRIEPRDLEHQASFRLGPAAAEHFLRVASGLDSRILGEWQILGQVRRAFLECSGMRSVGSVLSALGRAGIHTGRRVRRETALAMGATSSSAMAVEHLEAALGGLDTRTVVIVGTGGLASDTATCLARRRARRILVVSRENDRAAALASRVGGEGMALAGLPRALAEADAVITCSRCQSFLLTPAMLSRRTGAVAIVDLGVPRNVDPSVGRVSGVQLVHLDELVAKPRMEQDGVAQAEEIIADELDRFLRWHRERRAASVVAELVRSTLPLTSNLPPDEAREVKRNLHLRIQRLKEAMAA
jgi:glutamyl-tRNA reductase